MTLKSALRSAAPFAYDAALKLGTSKPVRTLRSLPALPAITRKLARAKPDFPVDLAGRNGLGALLNSAVLVLNHCDLKGLKPDLRFSNPLYAPTPGEDWLDVYFERRGALARPMPARGAGDYVPFDDNLTRMVHAHLSAMSIQRAHDLFSANLGVRDTVSAPAGRFVADQDIGAHTVGVHLRGTDKYLEAGVPEWEAIRQAVGRELDNGMKNIFVATDEPEFIAFIATAFGRDRTTDLGCAEIYGGGRPAHLTRGDPAVKAAEALQTMLVLSRCGRLLRGRSFLSAWAVILNPKLSTTTFGQLHKGHQHPFPEFLIS